VLPDDDAVISACADAAVLADLDAPGLDALVSTPPSAVREAWINRVLALRTHPEAASSGLRVVYTAMHGVGRELLFALFARAGWPAPAVVAAQAEPDSAFPTVAFPNPEEPGALDLALQVAEEAGADLILANDPDADRLAVVVRRDGRWVPLTGNQVGILLADDLLANGQTDRPRLVCNSIVSTSMLDAVAASHGAERREVLTGFKWIARAAIDFDAAGGRFVLGFEEALGYSAGSVVRDKDGVSAALLVADLAGHERAAGRTLLDRLDDLARRHGVYETGQRSLTLPGLDGSARIRGAMERLRANGPAALCGVAVARFRDPLHGVDVDRATGRTTPSSIPPADVMSWDLTDGTRVLARPSGTEPKIKFYVEVPETVAHGEAVDAARARARARLGPVADAIVEAAGLSVR
jgi:phosphomannomutase